MKVIKKHAATFNHIRKYHGLPMALKASVIKLGGKNPGYLFSNAKTSPIVEEVVNPTAPKPQSHEPKPERKVNFFDRFETVKSRKQLYLYPAGSSQNVFNNTHVSIIGELSLPQCKKYRVFQKIEIFRLMNKTCSFSHWQDQPRAIELIQSSTHIIFYRVPDCATFDYYLRECHRLGVTVFYDIDDPIFDYDVYKENKGLDHLPAAQKRHLLSDAPKYLSAMKKTSNHIGSTPGICRLIRSHVNKEVFLWPNLLDAEAEHAANMAESTKSDKSTITIGYMSGSKAHEDNFRSILPTLSHIMQENSDVRLKVVGYLEMPDELEAFSDRINRVPFSSYNEYIKELASVDINIVPLTVDRFNESKSAIRYLEASIVKVPTIVSDTGDYENVAKPGKKKVTCLVARSENDWSEHLQKLIDDKNLRRTYSALCHSNVTKNWTVAQVGEKYGSEFFEYSND